MNNPYQQIKAFYQFAGFRKNMAKQWPSVIGFEMTTRCNAFCNMCVRRDSREIVPEDMDFALLEKVVDEARTWPSPPILFNLTGASEPTLYGRLVDSIALIKKNLPGVRIKMITNGISLTPHLSGELIKAGLDELMISLNGTSRADYLALCGTDQYETVVAHIKGLLGRRRTHPSNALCINVNLKRHPGNAPFIEPAVDRWKRLLRSSDVVSVSDILPLRETAMLISACISVPRRYPCAHLWGEIKLDVQGNIYPCDGKVMDYHFRTKSELWLGNIGANSILEVYGSVTIKDVRSRHLMGRFADLSTCKSCPVWSIFPNYWLRNYLFPFSRRMWL